MTDLEAFQHMVLSITTIRTMRNGRGDTMPAQCLEGAMTVTEDELAQAIKESGGGISDAATEFAYYEMEGGDPPDWYKPRE